MAKKKTQSPPKKQRRSKATRSAKKASNKALAPPKVGNEQIVVKTMRIKRHVGDEKAVFANHIIIRHDQSSTFNLFFFDAQAPLIIDGDPVELQAEFEAQDYVDARCVSRVALPMHVMPGLIRALQTNLENRNALNNAITSAGYKDIEDLKEKQLGKK